ncbi:glutamate 5-kinase [Salinisphaera hydrothermalis C41B8]|uniref:Glutamate 5-kinase n=2 Tax=Salinisphaera TaxID=180541 RepID=A0A084IJL2_SALHC|nr:glutamate 5-kinase [Salinisphaera hydrothermalis C41B8]
MQLRPKRRPRIRMRRTRPTMSARERLPGVRRWVVKIGSALLTADGQGLDRARLEEWARQIAALAAGGNEVVLVSSGSVAEGMVRLGWRSRPLRLDELQAAASVGQAGLVEAYGQAFAAFQRRVAQVLLTHDDVSHRGRYLNARRTLMTLLGLGVVPIVNENDAIAMEEIRVGDNDTLAALVVNLIDADGLVILTDQAGVFDADPRTHPEASLVPEIEAYAPELLRMAGASGGVLGRGGMQTKILAARQAADSDALTVIVDGRTPRVLERVAAGEALGTLLLPRPGRRRAARKNWLAGQRRVRGRLQVDAGAARVLREAGRSLLPIGVTAVEGDFHRGDLVACISPDGEEVARGLVNYDAREARLLMGQSSERIPAILGYDREPEFIHRDNLVTV